MYSSSTLNGPAKTGCWRQLDYAETNADSLFPLDYNSYIGQAAHHVMQVVAETGAKDVDAHQIGRQVGQMLTTSGREFRGRKEPPLPAEDVWKGVDIALLYLEHNEVIIDGAETFAERDWVHPTIPYRALIDLVQVYEEEDIDGEPRWVREITDYKTSWQAGKDELDTLQRWGQAICVWRDLNKQAACTSILRQRVVNLRTHAEFINDIDLTYPSDVALLESWERRIEGLCKAADDVKAEDGVRPANPGVGCLSCPYRHICSEAKDHPIHEYSKDTRKLAAELAFHETRRALLTKIIKFADPEAVIGINGGSVGFKTLEKTIVKKGHENEILSTWLSATGAVIPEKAEVLNSIILSLLSALKLTSGNIGNLAKVLYQSQEHSFKESREDFIDSVTKKVKTARFGVWPNKKELNDEK